MQVLGKSPRMPPRQCVPGLSLHVPKVRKHYCSMAVLVTLPGNLSFATHQAGVWLLSSTLLTSGP